jgi:hypothetical protein
MTAVVGGGTAGSGTIPLFEAALTDRWAQLPPEIRALHEFHDVARLKGTATVRGFRTPRRPENRTVASCTSTSTCAARLPYTASRSHAHSSPTSSRFSRRCQQRWSGSHR